MADKQGLVDDVFHKVARRYDLMNDLMSGGLHRAWKDILVTAVNPPKNDRAVSPARRRRRHRRYRHARGRGRRRGHARSPRSTSIPDMLAVGRERAQARGLDHAVTFVEGNAEALALPDKSFDAYTIAFGIRNVPRIEAALEEAYRVLKPGGHFLCLEFSSVDVPGLERLYDLYSFNVIPALGRAVADDAESYRYLVESIRKFPKPERLRRDDPRAPALPGSAIGRCPAASSRCIPAGGCRLMLQAAAAHRDFLPRSPRPAGPRRFRVRARGRVRHGRSGERSAAGARGALSRAPDRAPAHRQQCRTLVGGSHRGSDRPM